MIHAQIITDNGLPQFAVLPYREYLELAAKAGGYDDVDDYLDYERAVKAKEAGGELIAHEDLKKEILGDK